MDLTGLKNGVKSESTKSFFLVDNIFLFHRKCQPISLKTSVTMASESVTFNAMLTYVAFSRETSANELIAKACKQFYSIEELQEAKEALWKVGDKDIMPAYVKRRDSTVRSEVDAIIDDILNAM